MSTQPTTNLDWLPEVDKQNGPSHSIGFGSWKDQLLRNLNGAPKACIQNAVLALEHALEWQGVLGFDQSTLRVMARVAPPWNARPVHFAWSDEDDVRAAAWMQQHGIMVSKDIAGQAVQAVARRVPFHPIRDYLNALVWDEIPRIDD